MRVYQKLPDLAKWEKFFLTVLALGVIFFFITDNSKILAIFVAGFFGFLMISFVLGEALLGNSDDLSFWCILSWYLVEIDILSEAKNREIIAWCNDNIEGKWKHNYKGSRFMFKNYDDAFAFKMRWL